MVKKVSFLVGLVVGAGLVFVIAHLVYKPVSRTKVDQVSASLSISTYIEKQKQTLLSYGPSDFDTKSSQQLEQFTNDAITITNTAKNNPKHQELQKFAADSTYSWGYNHEGILIFEESIGLRPKHEGKHCDSIGSC